MERARLIIAHPNIFDTPMPLRTPVVDRPNGRRYGGPDTGKLHPFARLFWRASMIGLALLLMAASPATASDIIFTDTFEEALPPPTCFIPGLTRWSSGNIEYSTGIRTNVDLTRFENIWGHATNSDSTVPWPGRDSAPAFMDWPKTQYIAARFLVPVDFSASASGLFVYSTYYSGPLLTLAISTTCADFAPANPLCLASDRGNGDAFLKWLTPPLINGCPLTPGMEYFVNIRMADPQPEDCGGGPGCTLGVINSVSVQ
jgi:hypothetical protein